MSIDKQMMGFAVWVSIYYERVPIDRGRYIEKSNRDARVPHFDISDLLKIYKIEECRKKP